MKHKKRASRKHSGRGWGGFTERVAKGFPSSCLRVQRADGEESGIDSVTLTILAKAVGEIKAGFVQFVLSNLMALWMCIPGAFFPYLSHYCLFCLRKATLLCQLFFFLLLPKFYC